MIIASQILQKIYDSFHVANLPMSQRIKNEQAKRILVNMQEHMMGNKPLGRSKKSGSLSIPEKPVTTWNSELYTDIFIDK